jgi:sec-independent protein translocase protein TatC
MSALGRGVKRVLGAPIRLLTWPVRRLRGFINLEPEDTPTADVFSRALAQPSVLIEHLDALRRHLLRSLLVLALTTAISFALAPRIIDWMAAPIGGRDALQAIEVTESIGAFMRVSLLSGFALALPYISLELFAFVNPGLKPNERVLVLLAVPTAALLFAAGLAFTYYVVLPAALPFLLNFLGIPTTPRPLNYIRFVTNLMLWIGVAFEFPLLIYVLASLGLVKARSLARSWRFAIVGIAVLAAAATPTVDPVNMALVMVPMIGLYLISILLAAIAQAGRRRRVQRE